MLADVPMPEVLPGESPLWYSRAIKFIAQRSPRSKMRLYRQETGRKPPFLPGNWRKNAVRFRWHERADEFDQAVSRAVFQAACARFSIDPGVLVETDVDALIAQLEPDNPAKDR